MRSVENRAQRKAQGALQQAECLGLRCHEWRNNASAVHDLKQQTGAEGARAAG